MGCRSWRLLQEATTPRAHDLVMEDHDVDVAAVRGRGFVRGVLVAPVRQVCPLCRGPTAFGVAACLAVESFGDRGAGGALWGLRAAGHTVQRNTLRLEKQH